MSIPKCPVVDAATRGQLHALRRQLYSAGLVRSLSPEKCKDWDATVREWSEDCSLPLIIRRSGHPMMCCTIPHHTGRKLAPSDNSPAQWMVIQVFSDVPATIDFVRRELAQIPMTQRMGKQDREQSEFRRTLDDIKTGRTGTEGWYLAHRRPVGLGQRKRLEDVPIKELKQCFIDLMSPSNMCLVSKEVSGIAEMNFFFEEEEPTR